MKILLIISSLSSGGAERVMSIMANYWTKNGIIIELLTLDSTDSDFYELDPSVLRLGLAVSKESSNPWQAINNNINRLKKLRAAIKSSTPDVVISFMDKMNVLTLLATRGLGLKIIIMEHTNPESHHISFAWRALRRLSYRYADLLGVLTERARPWAQTLIRKGAVFVMPNPIRDYRGDAQMEKSLRDFVGAPAQARVIVSMGRLSFEKGFDMLIKAFAKAHESMPELWLVIFGEGRDRDTLQRLVGELALSGRVCFPGRVSFPIPLLKQSDLFVMSSRYEGFPMALCEAMACGLPVISFDCPTGPGEIIRNGVDGILVPPEDINALSKAIVRLIGDEVERKAMASRAPEILERFSEERVMAEWDKLLTIH